MVKNCPNIKLNQEVINFINKFKSDEDLLRGGGIPIKMLDNLAFGFSEKSIKTIMPKHLKIRWKEDLEHVKWDIRQKGTSLVEWAKTINLTEPIDVDYWKSEELGFEEGFYIQDGHHRYYAAKILKKPLNVNLEIKINPIVKINPELSYDDFHRCAFAQVKNVKTESIRKLVREILKESELNEDALRLKNLRKDVALFIREINQGYDFVLYNPQNNYIYATITIVKRDYYGNSSFYYVTAVAAKKGFGPFIYELAMMYIYNEKMGLMPQRDGDVRGDAFSVWEKFFERGDVNKQIFDLLDDNFRCDIIIGSECEFESDEDKLTWWSELGFSEKEALKVFNTIYYIKPDNQYYELKKRGDEYIKNGFDIQKAIDSASEFWDNAYMNESVFLKENYDSEYKNWKRKNVTIRGIANQGQENNRGAMFGRGLYTAFLSNKQMAREYGQVNFVVGAIPKNPKIFRDINEVEIWMQNNLYMFDGEEYPNSRRFNQESKTIEDEMMKRGYDGIIIKGREMVNFNPPENILYFKNENELFNYYNIVIKNNN